MKEPEMTRADGIRMVKEALHRFVDEKIIDDCKVDVDVSNGNCQILVDGEWARQESNDTYTLVVLVNGGARNTERHEMKT